MANIVINTDLDKLPKQLRNFADQAPFAISGALNNTAYKTQQKIRGGLDKDLTLRNRWTQSGIRYNKATKDKLAVEIGSRDWYIESLVRGGTRRPRVGIKYKGKSYLLIPSKESKTKGGKLRKFAKAKTFVVRYKGNLWLARRRTKKRYPIQFIGLLSDKAKYKKNTVHWENYTDKFVPKTFHREFVKAMVRAARTAK